MIEKATHHVCTRIHIPCTRIHIPQGVRPCILPLLLHFHVVQSHSAGEKHAMLCNVKHETMEVTALDGLDKHSKFYPVAGIAWNGLQLCRNSPSVLP